MELLPSASSDDPAVSLGETPPEVKRCRRQQVTAGLCSLVLGVAFVAIMALIAGPRLGRIASQWTGDKQLIVLAFLYAAALELLSLPFDFYSGFVLEHRHGLSKQTLARWLWRKVKRSLGRLIRLVLTWLGIYILLLNGGAYWWLWAAGIYWAVPLFIRWRLPVEVWLLVFKATPLEDPLLLARLRPLATGAGLSGEQIYQCDLGAVTGEQPYAGLGGWGRARFVLLGDTLLDQFTPEEIEVIFAHEVGHHVHRHLPKTEAWNVLQTGVSFWLVDLALRHAAVPLGYPAFDDPSALALIMLVFMAFHMLLWPAENGLSRFFERQCDRYALQHAATPDAYRSAFVKLARLSKDDHDPHPAVVWLFATHPPIRQRLLLADTVVVS